jgi:hypothetical protein
MIYQQYGCGAIETITRNVALDAHEHDNRMAQKRRRFSSERSSKNSATLTKQDIA